MEAIPKGLLPGSKEQKDSESTLDFHAHSRLFFALDAPDDVLTKRRKLSGGAVKWQTPAIIFRVLLGLLDLGPTSTESATSAGDRGDFSIDSVEVWTGSPDDPFFLWRTIVSYRFHV
ncbi:MAG TPA: hypothetical protein VGC79_14060, partial [Polyangiaceae bacterium]